MLNWPLLSLLTLALFSLLKTLVFPQATNVDEIARKNFLGFQALASLNSTLLDNLLMNSQPNAEFLCIHL